MLLLHKCGTTIRFLQMKIFAYFLFSGHLSSAFSSRGEPRAGYNLTDPIPLQVEHVAVEFIVEPFRRYGSCLRTVKTCAQWCRVDSSYFTHNWETRGGRERLIPSRTDAKDLPTAHCPLPSAYFRLRLGSSLLFFLSGISLRLHLMLTRFFVMALIVTESTFPQAGSWGHWHGNPRVIKSTRFSGTCRLWRCSSVVNSCSWRIAPGRGSLANAPKRVCQSGSDVRIFFVNWLK